MTSSLLAIDCGGEQDGQLAFQSSTGEIQIASTGSQRTNEEDLGKLYKEVLGSDPETPEVVLLLSGPGSFTGLRIALAFAQGVASGLEIPICTINRERLALACAEREIPLSAQNQSQIPSVRELFELHSLDMKAFKTYRHTEIGVVELEYGQEYKALTIAERQRKK